MKSGYTEDSNEWRGNLATTKNKNPKQRYRVGFHEENITDSLTNFSKRDLISQLCSIRPNTSNGKFSRYQSTLSFARGNKKRLRLNLMEGLHNFSVIIFLGTREMKFCCNTLLSAND